MDKYVFQGHTVYYVEDQNRLRSIWERQGVRIIEKDLLTDAISEKYDGVISVAVIEHQKDPQDFLRSIIAPLLPDGRIYLATPNVTHLLNRIRFMCGRPPLGNLKEFFDAGIEFTGHWREYSLNELKSFFEWVGLDMVTARNLQSMKPSLRIKSPRDVYVHFFRLFGGFLPGCGDTNILVGRKQS